MISNTPVFDIVIAGAGIVGLSTAWQLSRIRPDLRIAILEKESKPAQHQSSRNSGVIHSGVYYEPGSAKATNCLKGYQMLLAFADAYKVPYQIRGKLIAAVDESELPQLRKIFQNGITNGLQGLEILDAQAGREAEPHVRSIESVWVPQAGIIDYGAVCREMVRQFQEGNVSLYFDHQVTDFRRELHHSVISTSYGDFNATLFMNCTGLYADRIALLTGMTGPFRILPFRGEFYTLNGVSAGLVRNLVYPVPDPRFPFLGVHFTPRLDGSLEAGPNAVLAFAREGYDLRTVHAGDLTETLTYTGFYRMAARYWKKGWEEMHRSVSASAFLKSLQHLIPGVRKEDMRPSRSGVRAQCVGTNGRMIYDYQLLEDDYVINLVNAPSPAATSALAIGAFLAQKALDKLH